MILWKSLKIFSNSGGWLMILTKRILQITKIRSEQSENLERIMRNFDTVIEPHSQILTDALRFTGKKVL